MNLKNNGMINSISIRIGSFLFAKSDKTSTQFLRYIFVGGIAYAVDFGSLFFLTEVIKIHYLISAAIAFILGLLTNYTLSIFWVFARRALTNKQMEFLIFAVIGLVGLGLNEGIIWFFTDLVHFHYLISKVFSAIVVFSWNFFARKRILFS
jgi:putative flippase GtrA